MPTPTIIKPEDASDTPVAFDLPKKVAPYLRDLHAVLKRDGESLDDWICRFVCEAGVRHALQQKLADLREAASDLETTDSVALNEEHTGLLK